MFGFDDLILEADLEPEHAGYPAESNHPVWIPGEYTCMVLHRDRVRIWLQYDEDFNLEMLSSWEPFEPTLYYEVDAMGWNGALQDLGGIDGAIANGVTYLQPFLAEIYCRYSSYGEGDWDCDMEYFIVERSKIDPAQAASRFDEWIKREAL